MNPQDNPHVTAYTLGELDAAQAREIHQALHENSAAAHELEQIEAVTDALRHGAPIPSARLTPDQRHAVLHPTNLPRFVQPMMPRPAPVKKPAVFWNTFNVVLKAAAVIALTGGAFLLGWQMQPQAAPSVAEVTPPSTEPVKAQIKPVIAEAPPKQPAPAVIAEPKPVSTPAKPVLVVAEAPKPAPIVIAKVAEDPKPAPQPPLNLGFTLPHGAAAFASTSKEPTGKFTLLPALVRPAPAKKDAQAFAAPVSNANAKAAVKPAMASELLIHSWQSEVATCPWNETHRLLRIVIQLPANQTAVTSVNAAAFPMEIAFDPLAVKQFRFLCERHIAAPELEKAGTHVVWYEFEPNGKSDIKAPAARQIATVTVGNTRFTQKTVGPFDDSKLQVLDRGFTLENARDDFVFESAVVGFGMLMRGAGQLGSLNNELVLSLATRAKAESPERARFIKLVQDAQRAAGL
jgi:outer membrane biosynthesis protein TonB